MIALSKTAGCSLLFAGLLSLEAMAAPPKFKYTAEELQKSWERVYAPGNDGPLFQDLVDKVLSQELLVLGAQDLNLNSDEDTPRAIPAMAQGDSGQVVTYFPVKSLSAEQGKLLYSNLHKIEGLVQKYQLHIGSIEDRHAPADFEQTLIKRQNALDLERFTANVSMFLLAEKLDQKCRYYSRAQTFVDNLKTLRSDLVPDGWAGYASSVQEFAGNSSRGFARIPAHLCKFQTKLSRAEDETIVRKKIEATLIDAVGRAIEKHDKVIKNRKDALQAVVNKSYVAIPIDKVSALNRGFRDTNSLLMMIRSDLLLLYTDSGTTKSLMNKIEEKIKNMAKGTDQITVAHKALDSFETALKPFLSDLESVSRLPMLTEAQRQKVSVCNDISKILSSGQDAANAAKNQENFNKCLIATAELYKEARETMVDDPAQVELSSKIVMLLSYFQALKSGN
ncbi:MAG: hypothetical protein M3Q07_02840 [Pseudobdellovibrionaceae bacterium]|nr:hypothetical protein [Pseudobdellovibrionaceae bacterium]